MSYSNITVVTSQGTYGYSLGATTFNPILYNTLDLIPGIPHNAQLEVERIFSIDRNGVTATIPNFLNDTNVSVVDKQKVFIIPSDRITYDTTGNRIVNINLPASGADVYNFSYIPISGPSAGVAQTIAVPQLREGDNIIVRRKTVSNVSLVQWTPGSKLTTAQLNLNTTQLLFLVQEILNKVTIVSVSTEQILDNAITSPKILNKAVTFAKLQDLSGPLKLLGSGSDPINFRDVREMSVGPGFDVTGNTIDVKPLPAGQRNEIEVVSPLTDWRINPNVVTYAKMQDVSAASRLLGRGSAAGSGDPQELSTGPSLSFVGTQLNVTTPLTDGNKGDLTVSGNGTVFTFNNDSVITTDISNNAVTYAKLQLSNTGNRVLGSTVGGTQISEVQVNADMLATAAVTNDKIANSSISSNKLQASAVTNAAINNNAVTYDKMQTVVTANRVLGSTAANGPVTELQVSTDILANNAVSFAKMQQVPTNVLLGRATAGSGNVETIAITQAGRDFIDDNSVADMRQTLQLGSAALESAATFALAAHVHGNINSAGQVGTTPNLPLITGSNGLVTTGTFGTTVSTFCQGNDARLSDARTPLPHIHPISDVTNLQTSLDAKSSVGHTHVIGDVANLQTTLNNKAALSHTHTIAEVTNLQSSLDGKAATVHTHTIAQVTNLQTELDNKAPTSHSHTIANVTGLQTALDGKAASSHTHAMSDITNLNTTLAGKANTSHTHAIVDVTGLQAALDAKVDDSQITAFGLSLIDDVDDIAARNTLGLGSAATQASTAFAAASHTHTLANITNAGSAASRDVPAVGVNATTTQVVMGDDTRLTNARTPTAHTHTLSNITDVGTAAGRNIPATGNAGSTEVVLGSDTRLTDARTPIAHTHTLAQITDAGSAASKVAPAAGVNATSTQVVMGDDTRLTNARTPVAHTHQITEVIGLDAALASKVDDSQITAFGLSLVGDANAGEARATLELGTAAQSNVGDFAAASHTHTLSQITDAGSAASRSVPNAGVNATTTQVVMGDDTRLTNARTPVAHTHTVAQITDAGSAATKVAPATGVNATATQVVMGDDTRLTNSRTPTAHVHTISEITNLDTTLSNKSNVGHTHTVSQITDAGSAATKNAPNIGVNATTTQVVMGDDTRLTDSRTPIAHTHTVAQITDAGSAATKNAPSTGVNATTTQVVMGDDTRLTNARTPVAHVHAIADITNLDTSLNNKSNIGHTHSTTDITSGTLAIARGGTGVSTTPTAGQLLIGNNTGFTLATITAGTNIAINNTPGGITISQVGDPVPPSSILENGTYGDITISSNTWTVVNNAISGAKIANDAVTFAKMQNIATDRLLGRATAGTGDVEEITLTAAGRALLDDTDAAAQRDTLGLGSAATKTDTFFAAASHTHTLSQITDAGTAASRSVPATGNASATQVVLGNDTRLSDARTPTTHTHTLSQITDAGTAASRSVPTSGNATSTQVVLGDDTRLTNARTPTAHTHTLSEITDAGSAASKVAPATGVNATTTQVVMGDDTRLTNARTPVAHTHVITDITNLDTTLAGKSNVGHTHTLANITDAGSAAYKSVPNVGVNATTTEVVMGDDTRLTNARTPVAHTHTVAQITDAGSAAYKVAPATGVNATTTQVVMGDDTRLTNARTPTAHTHTVAQITDAGSAAYKVAPNVGVNATTTQVVMGDDTRLTNARTPTAHTHSIAEVTGLQTALDSKVDDSQITSFALTLLDDTSSGQARGTLGLGTSATLNISALGDAASGEVVTGSDSRLTNARTPVAHTHTISDITNLQSSLDAKVDDSQISAFALTLLDDISASAMQVTLGLGSAATQASSAFAAASHTHTIANVTNLQTSLDGKANTVHSHAITDVTNLQTTLDGKSNVGHTHAIADVTNLQTELNNKAALSHTHAISDVTGLQTALDGKAATSHTHTIANVTGLQTALDGKLNSSAVSSFMLTVLDDATAAAAQTTLGLGSAATQPSTAFAAASHTHNTNDIVNNAITYAKMQNVATANRVLGSTTAGGPVAEVQVQTGMVADSAITAAKLGTSAVETAKINDLAVTSAKLANGAATSDKITNHAVTYNKIQTVATANRVLGSTTAGGVVSEIQINAGMLEDGLVTTAKIADANVTAAKLASGAAVSNIGNGNVTAALLASDSVTTAKILDLNVTTGKIAANAVTYGKMQAVVTANRLLGSTTAGGAVSEVQVATDMVADGAITLAKIASNAVDATKIASNAVTTAKILDNNVTLAKLPLSVTANRVLGATTAGSAFTEVQIQTNMIADGAVTSSKLGSLTIGNSQLLDDAVSTSKIVNLAVSTGKLADNAVTDAKLRTGAATSVIGRSENTVGNVADIVASTDGQVLHRTGGTLQFGTLGSGSISDGAITTAKIANIAANRVLGTVSGAVEAVQVQTGMIADGAITASKFVGSIRPVRVYLTSGSGTWTVPAGVTNITAYMFGGGSRGYYSTYNFQIDGRYSGMPGAYTAANFNVTPGSSFSYTIGNGGYGSNTAAASISDGGDTTFLGFTVRGGKLFTTPRSDFLNVSVGSQPTGATLIDHIGNVYCPFNGMNNAIIGTSTNNVSTLASVEDGYSSFSFSTPVVWNKTLGVRPGSGGSIKPAYSTSTGPCCGVGGAVIIEYYTIG